MFAVLAGPKSRLSRAADLAGVPVAISKNTIIEYTTRHLLKKSGLQPDRIKVMEVKNIPVRFQMLMAGKIKAATLPEGFFFRSVCEITPESELASMLRICSCSLTGNWLISLSTVR